jgi:hypothetical protein
MNKSLLFAAFFLPTSIVVGQFTQLNEPQIGSSSVLYVIDSLAPTFENITGNNVEWDYSSYGGYGGVTRDLLVVDPATTPFAGEYPLATKALLIQDFLSLFFTSTSDDRTSYGFVFYEPSFGDILAEFNSNPALQFTYPMDLNDAFTDVFEGTLNFDFVTPQSADALGDNEVIVDGFGTLKLANGVVIENVHRYKLIDAIIAEIDVFGTPQEFQLDRTQYEYYALDDSDLPVFVHATVMLKQVGAAEPISDFQLVMSSEDPTSLVNLTEMSLNRVGLYPNPTHDILTIDLAEEWTTASYFILDAMGKVVAEGVFDNAIEQIDVADLNVGMYTIQLFNVHFVGQKKFVKH